jgi:hypothetical protein
MYVVACSRSINSYSTFDEKIGADSIKIKLRLRPGTLLRYNIPNQVLVYTL